MALTDRAYLRDLLQRHGFTFSKAMGQNFLINPSVCPRMAEESGAAAGVGVLEIGPGIGVLTAELAKRADRVVCIELDKRLLPILDETLADFDNVEIINGDVMEVDLAEILATRFAGMPVVVCANLPYYITTPILMRLLESRLPIEAITVMVQKEAADRLCAAPGERECGAISAAIAYYATARRVFPVSAGSFMPAPKVDSAVIRLEIHDEPPVSVRDEHLLFEVVRGAFSQRRKTVVNALSSALGLGKPQVADCMAACGLSPTARAEQLTLADLAALSDAIGAVRG
jgi:16S rRNA (adenine1518-N6/adenine1519-N6)-dimethyltransferase